MTSTPVKDVGSILTNLAASQAGRSTAGTADFQKVWSNQMSKGAQNYTPESSGSENTAQSDAVAASAKQTVDRSQESSGTDNQGDIQQKENVQDQDTPPAAETTENGETGAIQESVSKAGEKPVDDTSADFVNDVGELFPEGLLPEKLFPKELSPEELEQAMAVLGTAATQLMQQVADVFGVTMEELHIAMEDLGMSETDLLKADALGSLVLKLGGAEDSYALVTDETLYDNYRTLMAELNNVLQESADELAVEPEQIAHLLEEIPEKAVPAQENAVTIEPSVQTYSEKIREPVVTVADMRTDVPLENQEVQNTQPQAQTQTGGQAEEEQPAQTKGEAKHTSEKTEDGAAVGIQTKHFQFGQLQTEEIQPTVEQMDSVPRGAEWTADTRNIMNQIMDYMKLQLDADTTSLEMQLHPASLGSLQVQIASKGGVLTAHFITQNEAVKAAIEGQMMQLRESFEEQGVKVEAIEVTVQTHEFEQNLEQGRGRNPQDPDKKPRIRRLNLNDSNTMEDLDEEDTLAADMMAASGSTVDYTV